MLPEDKIVGGFFLFVVLCGVLLFSLARCGTVAQAVCESPDRYYDAKFNACLLRERHR